ncbi:MAG: thioredoxin domain-containing protein [Chloroflexi bacterium]|nr:thioredoxin domain-containing protein [Chloroflexota bacterium]
MSNRLIHETSPYLLQHANNPVDWFPWGDEAFREARERGVPILLSVGYSSCHWCHVMERESFENEETAALMNEKYVSIKVDREERPDVDSIYMAAVQAMSGHGGWPMTVFLTPEGEPFYGGTYFPPDDRGGLPSFRKVLQAISNEYVNNKSEVNRITSQLVQRLKQMSASVRSLDPLTDSIFDQAFTTIVSQFDDQHGGIGLQPKFPQPMTYEFLLRYYARTGNSDALEMVEITLDQMARGGIYDQLGGGFHRYSTDTFWLVPHFEKMLYDNALLVKLYLHAYQVTGDESYRKVVEETLEYVRREMTSPEGGFYSAQDADSEGVEGKFFVWRPEQIEKLLGKERGELVNLHYGVTNTGNFEGRTILHVPGSIQQTAAHFGISEDEARKILDESRGILLEERVQRVAPMRDDKTLTVWNGLMLRAYAEAGAVLNRPDYVAVAQKSAEFLLRELREGNRVLRTHKDGRSKLKGYLDDYACLIDGLIALHEADLDPAWLAHADTLAQSMIDLFWDPVTAQFFDTGSDQESLIFRPRDQGDNAVPSGISMAVEVLLKLSVITDNKDYQTKAVDSLRSAREMMTRFPTGAGHWLTALDFYLSTPKEIVIVGNPQDDATIELARTVFGSFVPNHVLVSSDPAKPQTLQYPLIADRPMLNGQPTAYVCENYVCNLPVTSTDELGKQIVT